MKVVIAPDSFKESLSAAEVAAAIARGWGKVFPDAELLLLPMADGGEGMVDALLASLGGQRMEQPASGPLGVPVTARSISASEDRTWGTLPSLAATRELIFSSKAYGVTRRTFQAKLFVVGWSDGRT